MSSGGRDACPLFSAFGSYVEVAGKFAVPEPRMFIGGEDQHELSQRRVDFLFLEVGKRKAHSLVRSEEEGIHRRRRGRLVVGGSVGELLKGQDHSGADLSAEAYDAEESQTEPKENEHRKPKNTKNKDGVLFRFGEDYILLRRTLIKGTPSHLGKRQIVAG